MDALATYQRVKERYGDKVLEIDEKAHDPFMVVEPSAIVEICRFLRDDPESAMDCLSSEIGVDYKDRIEVVYELYSYSRRCGVVLKVKLPREDPVVATMETVWNSANWMEREIFDLIGVTFEGHSDLRRILMPEDWPGHPQRKDFVEPMEYHGISTVRESPIIRMEVGKK
jgi:NADH-quinone oxidoreductase subunit C